MRLSNKLILFVILAAGAILRFWNFADIPFAHDEFSALFRTDFSNFSDLINYGVKPDGHPAGIQVFLYYWVSIFGATEWVVKLPFALMGVASIWVMYKIGKLWCNETVGLVSAAFIASLQYTVLYSVTARPYISGMFFSLWMVWYWSQLVKKPTLRFWKNGLLFVLFSALCAYNHHFSLLFAALVWVSGLFFLPKKYWLKYVLIGLAVFIVYIPHLSIFFHQLGNKGVEGWLAKPESDWLWTYIRYIFHYSWVVLGVAVALVISGFFLKPKSDFSLKKFGLFALWFILPFAIGYYYSVHVSAVLQYSVLIFTFPFLFLALFGHLPQQKSGVNAILVGVILAVSGFTLIKDRLHFSLLHSSHYEHIVVDTRIADQQDSTLKLIDSHRKITAYYSVKNEVNLENVVWLDSLGTEREFRVFIQEQAEKYKHIYLGAWASINPNYVHIIKEYFPYVLFQNDYVGGSTSLFTKEHKPAFSARVSRLDLTQEATPEWSNIDSSHVFQGLLSGYLMDSTLEWSPVYSSTLSASTVHSNDVLWATVMLKTMNSLDDVSIVAVVEEDGEVVHWSNAELNRFIGNSPQDHEIAYHTLLLNNIACGPSAQVKFFVWNKGKKTFKISEFWINVKQGNRLVYGLTDEF